MAMEKDDIHLDKNVKLLWFAPIGALIIFLFLASTAAFLLYPSTSFSVITGSNYFLTLPVVALAFGFLAFGWIEVVYRNFTYQLHEQELIIRKGVFTHTSNTIPYSNIQDVTSERSLSERFLGIATLRFETSGSSHLISETELPGIANKERVINEIMEHVKRSKSAMGAETRAQGADTTYLLTGILNELKSLSLKFDAGGKNQDARKINTREDIEGKGKSENLYDNYKDFKKR